VRPKAVLLDALGTLLELPDPRPALVAGLARRGVTVTPDEAGAALRTEIAYYRAHHDEARDRAALALPLSYPVPAQPLMSLPRFLLVLWPLHLWFALWLLDRRRPAWAPRAALVASALGLGMTVAVFSTWHWIA
jgi:hypothetical protein